MSRVTQGHHQHLAASFHSLEVFRRGLGSTNNGVWLSLHRGQSDCPGLREKVRHEGSREHRDVGMNDVLREEAAAPDLPLSRGAQPQTTAEYEQNKPPQSPEDLTLLLMSGVSSCSKQTAGIIHTSPEFRHPCQQFANSPFPSTSLSQQTVCFDYIKKSASKFFCCKTSIPLPPLLIKAFSVCPQWWGQSGSAQSIHHPQSLSENEGVWALRVTPLGWAVHFAFPPLVSPG